MVARVVSVREIATAFALWFGCYACAPMSEGGANAMPGERAGQANPAAAGREPLTPWRSIRGAWRAVEAPAQPGTPIGAMDGERIQLQYPVSVAARGNDVFIADAALHQIIRYDRARETMSRFATLRGLSANPSVGLFVTSDQSLLVANPAESRVVLYDRLGRERQIYADDFNLARPIAASLIETAGEIWVLDGLHNHIVVFNTLGRSLRLIDLGNATSLHKVSAMAVAPSGVYLADPGKRAIVLFTPPGGATLSLPTGIAAAAMAIDTANRLFVADALTDAIQIFSDGASLGRVGGSGAGPLQFNQIGALAIDENLLYVADSLNARVQVFLINANALQGPR